MVRMLAAFAAIVLLAQTSFAYAGDYGSRDEAIAMVKRVEDMYASAGAEPTFQAVSDKSTASFHDRDLKRQVRRTRRSASVDR
jgi:cytochrome c